MSDPNWLEIVNTVSAAVGSFAIVIGLFGANSTIKANRRSAKQLRQSEVAENLIAISLSIEDAFRHMRNPIDRIPDEKTDDKNYYYKMRYERIFEYNPLFKKLRDAQIRVRAVLDKKEVDEAVETLFKARTNVLIAIEGLSDLILNDNIGPLTKDEKELRNKWKADMYGTFSERDELGTSILNAIKKIEEDLSPIARLES